MLQSFWLKKVNNCEIGITPYPSGGQDLKTELKSLVVGDKLVVISLLIKEEIIELKLEKEKQTCEELGFEFIDFPIVNGSIPGVLGYIDFIEEIYPLTKHRDRMLIHCHGGRSRSSLIAIGLMLKHGLILNECIQSVSKIRGLNVPRSNCQLKLLNYYAQNVS